MSESMAMLIASIEVLGLWAVVSAFIITYALGSPGWRYTPVGRTLMGMAATMWILVTLALTARWFPGTDGIFQYLALATYAVILLSWVRLLIIVVLIQRGVITPTRMDPHPVRDWIRRRRSKEK